MTEGERVWQEVRTTVAELEGRGWRVQVMAEADGYPIFALESPGQVAGRPRLLISSGIHGEEPGGPAGVSAWLRDRSPAWSDRLNLTVFPCLNPWGIVRGTRTDPDGNDLNRQFNRPVHPAVAAAVAYLQGRRFDLFMDCHEDSDFMSLYLYEVRTQPDPGGEPSLGQEILERAAPSVPISHGDEVGALTTEHGLLGRTFDPSALPLRDQLPIALHVVMHHAPHAITLETPALQPLALRAGLHVEALELACRRLSNLAELC